MLGRPGLGRHRGARGARSRRLGGPGLPASSRLRLLERVETLLERRHTTVKRIDRPQPASDITEALLDPVHHPTRSLDRPSERFLADVGKPRDHVPVVRGLLRVHDLTIAPPGTHLDEVPEAADAQSLPVRPDLETPQPNSAALSCHWASHSSSARISETSEMATGGLNVGGDVEQALENVGVPSYVLDATGIVRWLNPAAERIVGDVRGRH